MMVGARRWCMCPSRRVRGLGASSSVANVRIGAGLACLVLAFISPSGGNWCFSPTALQRTGLDKKSYMESRYWQINI